jgi:hypothetical protein
MKLRPPSAEVIGTLVATVGAEALSTLRTYGSY